MRAMMTLGVYGSGCIVLLGVASACSIIGLGFSGPLLVIGFLGIIAFSIGKTAFK